MYMYYGDSVKCTLLFWNYSVHLKQNNCKIVQDKHYTQNKCVYGPLYRACTFCCFPWYAKIENYFLSVKVSCFSALALFDSRVHLHLWGKLLKVQPIFRSHTCYVPCNISSKGFKTIWSHKNQSQKYFYFTCFYISIK